MIMPFTSREKIMLGTIAALIILLFITIGIHGNCNKKNVETEEPAIETNTKIVETLDLGEELKETETAEVEMEETEVVEEQTTTSTEYEQTPNVTTPVPQPPATQPSTTVPPTTQPPSSNGENQTEIG